MYGDGGFAIDAIILIYCIMSNQPRPHIFRSRRACKSSSSARRPQLDPIEAPHAPADPIQIKLHFKQRQIALNFRALRADSGSRITSTPSQSKFRDRYNVIRSSRKSIVMEKSPDISDEGRKKEEFQRNKKRIFMSSKVISPSVQNSLVVSNQLPEESFTVDSNALCTPLINRRYSRPGSSSIEFVQLRKISSRDLMLMKTEGEGKQNGEAVLTGYWRQNNIFVSLIPMARNQKVSFEHSSILPIYAEVQLENKRYVISDQYKNFSLKNLLEEFGPFQELLAKRCLKQIALGLQHMHSYRKGHNRLSATAILYNKNGEFFINPVNSTSFVPSKDELAATRNLHYFAPEFLLAKGHSKSLKNDVWALGCLALLMLTSLPPQYSPLHPYNSSQSGSAEMQMVDNLKQLYKEYLSQKQPPPKMPKTPIQELSNTAKSFISKCLQTLSDNRPSIKDILDHQFFEGI